MEERIETKNTPTQEAAPQNWGKGMEIFSRIFFAFIWVILVLLVASTLVLPYYMLVNSLKDGSFEYVNGSPFAFPETPIWENYSNILAFMDERLPNSIAEMFGVSVIMATIKPFLAIMATTIWAYVIAKYDFFGREFFFKLGIVVMILPIVGSTASAMQVNKALGMYDNIFMNIITSPAGGFYGTNFLLMYGTFKSIPWDYAEAAQIDGASRYTIFFTLYLRMALPQVTVLFVLSFMGAWNDYSSFMFWLPSYANFSYGLYLFEQAANSYRIGVPERMAGFTIVMIPVAILYLSTQKIITSKFAVGGLKG